MNPKFEPRLLAKFFKVGSFANKRFFTDGAIKADSLIGGFSVPLRLSVFTKRTAFLFMENLLLINIV